MVRCLVVVMLGLVAASSNVARAQSPAARTASDTGATSGLGVVTGTVYDSVAGAPLAGALIQMRLEVGAHQGYAAITDSAGTYRIANVAPGRYVATFFHPRLDSLGLLPVTWQVDVNDSLTRSNLATPSAATIWAAACSTSDASDSTGLVVGHVRDADTGTPLSGSVVTARWSELVLDPGGVYTKPSQLAATANADGLYVLCGVPTGGVLMRAEHSGAASGVVEIAAAFHGVVVRDFGIGRRDSTVVAAADSDTSGARTDDALVSRRGTARLEGVVHRPDGGALSDVDLVVYGSDARANSDEKGRFVLTELPAGTYTLEARHVGFAPQRLVVDLASHRTTMVTVTMYKPVAVLSTVHVFGKEHASRKDLTGFLQRRELGQKLSLGTFYTRKEIEEKHVFHFTDLFREIPGVRIIRATLDGGHAISFRGCGSPTIYVDGMRFGAGDDLDFVLPIDDIAAMEVYKGPAEAPQQYRGGSCGSIVIWTGLEP